MCVCVKRDRAGKRKREKECVSARERVGSRRESKRESKMDRERKRERERERERKRERKRGGELACARVWDACYVEQERGRDVPGHAHLGIRFLKKICTNITSRFDHVHSNFRCQSPTRICVFPDYRPPSHLAPTLLYRGTSLIKNHPPP